MKKLLATILALVMALTLLPTAWASGGDNAAGDMTEDEATSLDSALKYDAANETYKLTKDVTLSNNPYVISGDVNLTIDLNNHTITGSNTRALWVKSGSLTLTGTGTVTTVTATTGTAVNKDSSVIRVGDGDATAAASLTVESGVTINAPATYGISLFGKNTGAITLNLSGTVLATVNPAIANNGTSGLSATTINIKDGATVKVNDADKETVAIYHPGSGTMTIGTATITGGIEAKGGTVDINGATVTAIGTKSHQANSNDPSSAGYAIASVGTVSGYPGSPVFNIKSGTITGPVETLTDNSPANERLGKISITGGTFSEKPNDAYVAENYVALVNSDKTYTVYAKGTQATSLTLDPASGSVKPNGTATFTYAYEGDGNVTVTSSDSAVATATVDTTGKTVTVKGVKAGTAKITVSAAANTYAAAEATYDLTVLAVGETKTETTVDKTTGTVKATVDNVNIDTTATEKVTVEIDAKDNSTEAAAATTTTVTIDKDVVKELNDSSTKVEEVEVVTNVATLTINSAALKDLTATEGDLVLTVSKTDETTTEKTFTLTAKVGDTNVFTNSKGTITVTVDWPTAPGFRQQLVCYYVDGNNRTRMGGTGYKDNTFSWDTNHFSTFEVVTETVSTNRAFINISGSSATTTTTTTTVKKASSATTFDAGVGIYAATAILSVTGMAWVGKKKH